MHHGYAEVKWLMPEQSGQFDGFVQERRNCIANALELRLSCTNPSISCVMGMQK